MYRWRFLICILFIFILLLLVSCGNREPQRKPVEPPVKLGFALADMNRDGNRTIKKKVDERKRKENLDITWLDAKNDPAEQDKQVDELVKKKVKVAVLQPVDPGQAAAHVEKLARAGIKVVVLENLAYNTPADGYIASDHTMSGQLLARFVTEPLRRAEELKTGQVALPRAGDRQEFQIEGGPGEGGQGDRGEGQAGEQGGGNRQDGRGQVPGVVDYSVAAQLTGKRPVNVIILRGDPRDQMSASIAGACREALAGREDVKVTGVYDVPGLDTAMVPAIMGEIMGRDERVDIILAVDSGLAVAAAEFLKAGGYEKNVLTAGVGASELAAKALVAGEHDAEVDVNPDMLGQFALDAAVALAQKGNWQYNTRFANGDYTVPARIVPVRLITAKNIYLLEERYKGLKKQQDGEQESQHVQQGRQQQGEGQEQHTGWQGAQGGGGQQGQQQKKTMLRIITQDGKTMEVQIDGEVKKIESVGGESRDGGQQEGQDDQQ